MADKPNESTAIPEWLRMLRLAGSIVTRTSAVGSRSSTGSESRGSIRSCVSRRTAKAFTECPYDYAETVAKTRDTSKSAMAEGSSIPTIAPMWIQAATGVT